MSGIKNDNEKLNNSIESEITEISEVVGATGTGDMTANAKKADNSDSTLKSPKNRKSLMEKYSGLSKAKKVQALSASILTLATLIILPVYAWFALGHKIEAFTKVKEPDNLDIRAGHYDAVQYFELRDIDIESIATGTPHCVVFSVSAGDYKIPYQIQLAHTTNIPFKYRIFRAAEYTSSTLPANVTPDVTYISMPIKNQTGMTATDYTFYYKKKTKEVRTETEVDGEMVVSIETVPDEITLTPQNADAGTYYGRNVAIGSGNYYNDTYDGDDEPEVYAVPVYEHSSRITYDSTSEHDYFILEITWDRAAQSGNFSEWNAAENKNETDMIYLTASRYSN